MSGMRTSWLSPRTTLTIQENEVHVWRADLDLPAAYLERLQSLLSMEEVGRADRFFFPKDRDHFIVSHACVRKVLSRYLETKPEQLSFVQNSHGKPALSTGSGDFDLEFNLTHSHRFALVAVTKGMRVGVDVELIRNNFGGLNIAQRFFSPAEFRTLSSLPEEQQSKAFFRCWTQKEAYIKAKGLGLSLPLDEFDVSVDPGEPTALLNSRSDPGETARWSLIKVDPATGYSGAVAVEGHSLALKCWNWNPEIDIPHPTEFKLSNHGAENFR
jgi:4'-phosphopantetheinyl transferase